MFLREHRDAPSEGAQVAAAGGADIDAVDLDPPGLDRHKSKALREKGFTFSPCYRIAHHGVTPVKRSIVLPHRLSQTLPAIAGNRKHRLQSGA